MNIEFSPQVRASFGSADLDSIAAAVIAHCGEYNLPVQVISFEEVPFTPDEIENTVNRINISDEDKQSLVIAMQVGNSTAIENIIADSILP